VVVGMSVGTSLEVDEFRVSRIKCHPEIEVARASTNQYKQPAGVSTSKLE